MVVLQRFACRSAPRLRVGRVVERFNPALDAAAGPPDTSIAGVKRVVLAGVNHDVHAAIVGADYGDRRAVEAQHDSAACAPAVERGVGRGEDRVFAVGDFHAGRKVRESQNVRRTSC